MSTFMTLYDSSVGTRRMGSDGRSKVLGTNLGGTMEWVNGFVPRNSGKFTWSGDDKELWNRVLRNLARDCVFGIGPSLSIMFNREIPYLAAILDVLAAEESIDERRVFTSGFSLNSMFAAYASFCFQGRIAGLWQGGSGVKLSREPPLMPEREGDCRKSDFVALGTSCVAEAPCTDCEYFPVDPILAGGEPVNALRVCTASYEDDFLVATTRDMYATLSSRGQHEVAMLEFPAGRGHSTPLQLSAWIVGCLGIVPGCSDECERWFLAECVGEGGEDAFTACMDAVHEGGAHGCAAQCAPTIAMLSTVEGPTVTQPAADEASMPTNAKSTLV